MLEGSRWCRTSSRTHTSKKKVKIRRKQAFSGLRCNQWRKINPAFQASEPYPFQNSFKNNVPTPCRWAMKLWWTLRNSLISRHQAIACRLSLHRSSQCNRERVLWVTHHLRISHNTQHNLQSQACQRNQRSSAERSDTTSLKLQKPGNLKLLLPNAPKTMVRQPLPSSASHRTLTTSND